VCVTSKKRPHAAAAHWLGSFWVGIAPGSEGEASATCTPSATQPVHVMAVAPHMHKHGIHGRVVLQKKRGTTRSLLDEPFSFVEQNVARLPPEGASDEVIVEPGDTLTSTCRYRNDTTSPLLWGESSDSEMCFFLLWAWPAGELGNGSVLGSVVGAPPNRACF
jgi:hypothetical protein